MKIEILGSGCKKCTNLAASVEQVANRLSLNIELEKVTDMATIVDYGVMSTPAIVINGTVVSSGSVPSDTEIEQLLTQVRNG
ncbi:TM0996/MTH895 family glutaredoxin-like protein [Shewanella mesophila]|uniref:thioredoxin family protein n=1 Tax=Shewanella mesophila TaxID=2864208 RepID=UPI001C661652|nr:thioredoxin family protein [Shewanella mesophila]QYJ85787.1 TM0996/MTH895 family glutaredoxin-like protein [Shewanella mesophila]